MLTSETLSAVPGIRHGFFTREGGVSEGLYASLNCGLGSGDDPDRVVENRARALARLGLAADRLATVYQVHSNRAAQAETPWPADERVANAAFQAMTRHHLGERTEAERLLELAREIASKSDAGRLGFLLEAESLIQIR